MEKTPQGNEPPAHSRPGLRSRLVDVAAYVCWASVTITQVVDPNSNTRERWISGGILLAFGLLMSTHLDPEHVSLWRTHLYLGAETALTISPLLLGLEWGGFPILFFLLSAQAMISKLSQRAAITWIALFTLVSGMALVYANGWRFGLLNLLAFGAGYFFFGAFGHALNETDTARQRSEELLAELQDANRRLQEYAAQVEELAVSEERNRLAREMHDTVGHHLTVAAVQLEGAQRLIPKDPERAAQMVGTGRDEVKQALSELRRAVAALRAPLEADLPLAQALNRLSNAFQEATGIAITLCLPGNLIALPEVQRLALYRAAQEALTNVQKHAAARNVRLELGSEGSQAVLTVSDDGVGFSPGEVQTGFGLAGLHERARQLGGTLEVQVRPEGGTRLRMHLPLPTEEGHV